MEEEHHHLPTMGTHVSFIFGDDNPYWGVKTFMFHGFGVQGQLPFSKLIWRWNGIVGKSPIF